MANTIIKTTETNSSFSEKIKFSVVIPTMNRSDMLRQAIEALCHQEEPGCSYEIIPVDNGSTDDTKAMVESIAKTSPVPIRYVFEPKSGSHYARNTGFKVAKGEILGLIDDDIIVDKNWVRNIVSIYDDPEVGAVGGKIILRWLNGEPPSWFEPYRGWFGELNYGNNVIKARSGIYINAGNYSIRKDTLFKVGGYNPCDAPGDIFIGDGESGLNLKVYDYGQKIAWTPYAVGWHVQDARKVTLSYMRLRAKHHGMGSAYTFYRNVNGDLFGILKRIMRRFLSIGKNIAQVIRFRRSLHKYYYGNLFAMESGLGFISYILRIKYNSRLRELVLKNDWLSE